MLEGIVVVFGAIRSVIISCAGITALVVAGLRAAPLTSALDTLLLDGILRNDEFFVAEAHHVFGEGHIIVIL